MKNTAKTSTSLLKKYILEKYGMKVNLKSDRYSGGSSLNVSYELGLCTDVLDAELSRLERGNFNGYTDMYEYKDVAERGINLNGVDLCMYSYVFVRREVSDRVKLMIGQAFYASFKFSDVEVPETIEDLRKSDQLFLDKLGVWSRSEYLHRFIYKMNFLTTVESDIVRVWFDANQSLNNYDKPLKMFYELSNGQIYDTTQTKVETELKSIAREKTINLNGVKLVDYSEKAVAVIGNTFEIKDQLKELGGRFNKFLTVEGQKVAGWIFSKGKSDEVADLLINYSEQ
ncbi:hypothetical protein BAZ12_19420 [Elizabethkingia miricola]|uniref:hypothetical protein n=1 Tax=Elizabethkingia miricola TaxID=172045 RepID=UPI000999C256|nr:hypothetical protein [Elizabethkingia miricola]OPC76181.1 hypothetical protein BAZ12_19420 [Elizabethkingia miricola]DAT28613.1 MAG TPA: DNA TOPOISOMERASE I [Caudoviricetes sp.]